MFAKDKKDKQDITEKKDRLGSESTMELSDDELSNATGGWGIAKPKNAGEPTHIC